MNLSLSLSNSHRLRGTAVWWLLLIPLLAAFPMSFALAQSEDEKAPVIVPNTPYYEPQPDLIPPAPRPTAAASQAVAPAPAGAPSAFVIPSGSNVAIEFDEELEFGDRGTFFQAALAEDLKADKQLVAPRGTPVRGEIYRDPSNSRLAIELTDLKLGHDWQPVYTEPLKAEAKKKGSGFWKKFLTGVGVAGVVAGRALEASNRPRFGGCGRRVNPSLGKAAIATGAQVGGALLLTRQIYGGRGGPAYKIKKGTEYSFTLEDDLHIR
ncbi:MAG TPA: hypothetical protein VLU25_08010 [Acidobacteriota bacterium]|nr:hypothetical protein [Acidobacteriota bacterium]